LTVWQGSTSDASSATTETAHKPDNHRRKIEVMTFAFEDFFIPIPCTGLDHFNSSMVKVTTAKAPKIQEKIIFLQKLNTTD
jgi:hypothetical protein